MNVTQYRLLLAAVTVVAIIAGAMYFGLAAKLHDADFFECPPGNTLHVCKVGTGPPNAECRNVGSGQTTIAPKDCG